MTEKSYIDILREIVSPERKPWVLFEHGTFIFLNANDVDLSKAAKLMLKKVGTKYSQTGTCLDFENCWIVESEHKDVATIIINNEISEGIDGHIIFLMGRHKRFLDTNECKVIHIEK